MAQIRIAMFLLHLAINRFRNVKLEETNAKFVTLMISKMIFALCVC